MKRFVAVVFLAGAWSLLTTGAQAPLPAPKDEQELLALIKEVQQQQLEIAANQTKIETKLADLAETIRIARIYSSRSR